MSYRLRNTEELRDRIKAEIHLLDIVGSLIQVSPSGSNYKAVCPFHEDTQPSFMIYAAKGYWKCFGCQENGDAISFIQRMLSLSYVEALEYIASKFGIDINPYKRELTEEEKREEYISWIYGQTGYFCQSCFWSYDPLIEKMTMKGISHETLKQFQIGYCPSQADLKRYLVSQGVQEEYLPLLELNSDVFYGKIVYPIFDARGRVVSFYARRQTDDPKYIGLSNAVPLLRQRSPYGFHIAKKHIDRASMIVVEGFNDVLAMHSHGFKNTVATMGTALTNLALSNFNNYGVRRLYLMWDADRAGRDRSLRVASDWDATVDCPRLYIVEYPGFESRDPDDMLKEQGPGYVDSLLKGSRLYFDYYLQQALSGFDLSTMAGKDAAISETMDRILLLPPLDKELAIDVMAQKTKIDKDALQDTFSRKFAKELSNFTGEEIVLGAMIRSFDFRYDAIQELKSTDFFFQKNKTLYQYIVDVFSEAEKFTDVALTTYMRDRGWEQPEEHVQHLRELDMNAADDMLIDIQDRSWRRSALKITDKAQTRLKDPSQNTMELLMGVSADLTAIALNSDDDSILDTRGQLAKMMERTEKVSKSQTGMAGYDMGPAWPCLGAYISGLETGRLILVGGFSGKGKSNLLVSLVRYPTFHLHVPTLWFSLEMSSEDMSYRHIAGITGQPIDNLRRGVFYSEEQKDAFKRAVEYYKDAPLYYGEPQHSTIEQIVSISRHYVAKYGVKLIGIDYLQMLSSENSRRHGEQRFQEYGDIANIIKKEIARKLDVCVIALTQLAPGDVKKDEYANAQQTQGSKQVMNPADAYLLFQHKKAEDLTAADVGRANTFIEIGKNRMGPSDVRVETFFNMDNLRIHEATADIAQINGLLPGAVI